MLSRIGIKALGMIDMARRYRNSGPVPRRIAHSVSYGNRVPGSKESERKRLEAAAEIVATQAREISSKFSRRIPLSVRVKTYGNVNETTYVEAGGPEAPQAYPFDPVTPPSRHPLLGDREHWYDQPYRPFLEEAAEMAADKAAEEFAKVIDDWCDETGLTKGH
jgi:hypothetical protein